MPVPKVPRAALVRALARRAAERSLPAFETYELVPASTGRHLAGAAALPPEARAELTRALRWAEPGQPDPLYQALGVAHQPAVEGRGSYVTTAGERELNPNLTVQVQAAHAPLRPLWRVEGPGGEGPYRGEGPYNTLGGGPRRDLPGTPNSLLVEAMREYAPGPTPDFAFPSHALREAGFPGPERFAFPSPEAAEAWFGPSGLEVLRRAGYSLRPRASRLAWPSRSGEQVMFHPKATAPTLDLEAQRALRAASAFRALVDAQEARAWHAVVPGGTPTAARLAFPAPLGDEAALALQNMADRAGLVLVDTGGGTYTVLSQVGGAKVRAQATPLVQAASDAGAEVEFGRHVGELERMRPVGFGPQSATKRMLERVPPHLGERLDPAALAEPLARKNVAEAALAHEFGLGPPDPKVQRLRALLGSYGVEKVRKGFSGLRDALPAALLYEELARQPEEAP